uniref:Vacuolar protein sorting-associated protein 54 N-terminal domain-containing protein n=1 Tax=Timema tahoe TaxID=61484 RepID=A0A7R9IGT4_9NEOP|nr:unnamed protein product [Timema tahoe]
MQNLSIYTSYNQGHPKTKKTMKQGSEVSKVSSEVFRILEIQKELQSTLKICQIGRSHLFLAKRQFTTASLGILANYRKRQVVQGLLHYLQTIKTLQRTDERLQELLSEGDYPSAIRLLLECQNAAATYKHFTCVAALSGKLQDTLEMAEEQLDQALSQVTSRIIALCIGDRMLCPTVASDGSLNT